MQFSLFIIRFKQWRRKQSEMGGGGLDLTSQKKGLW